MNKCSGFLLLFVFLMIAENASGQYFGRNKVKYHDQEFVVKNTPNFEIHHYNDDEQFMNDAAFITERWYERLRKIFGFRFSPDHPVIYYRNQLDFQQTFITLGFIGQGTRGFTEAFQQRLVMPYTGSYGNFDHIVGHEMVHVFQYKTALSYGNQGLRNLTNLPLWFIEGKAEYLSTGDMDAHTSMYLRDAMLREKLPSLRDMTRRQHEYFPYRFGHAFWAYVAAEHGDEVIAPLLNKSIEVGLNTALRRVLDTDRESLSESWKAAIEADYGPELAKKDTPGDRGIEILSPDKHAGRMNLAPSVSPDGNQVIFFSEKDLFSTELFMADARTGEIEDRLTRSASNRHFESLSFMESGGAWSPDGRRIAFVVTDKGQHKIAILDARSGNMEKRIDLDMQVDEISNPSWGPDGQNLVFSGLKNGVTNLYVVNRINEDLEQLTEGRNADMNPVWHPDGDKILFSSDRGEKTDFDRLVYGPYQLAYYHIEDESVEVLDIFDEGKHINPQFGPDGDNIYFISDQDGFSDIYRKEIATGDIYRVTEYATGVSGITEDAPAMSVAAETGDLMYSVFSASEYIVFRLDAEDAQGELYETQEEKRSVAGIPPIDPGDGREIVNAYLNTPEMEQDIGTEHPTSEYEPSLTLDYLGQGGVGVGIGGPFGSGVGGQITGQFSDVLGDHRLTAGVFMQGDRIEDLGMQAYYQNFENRWQWGVLVSRLPFSFSRFSRGAAGELIEDRQRQTILEGDFILQYPFSQTLRFETGLGYSQYRFSREQIIYFPGGDRDRTSLGTRPPMHFFNTNLYMVGDNSYFGFTSPVMGWRYRYGVRPTTGSLTYTTGLADFRYYKFLNPVTLAARGIYQGRYGQDREAREIREMYLGNNYYMRGYIYRSADIENECGGNVGDCPQYDRLFGSQIGVVNLEARLPLFGNDQFGLINFPYLPTELSGFFDAGIAWDSHESPVWDLDRYSEERVPVMSTGLTSRFNLLGALIVEIYYAYPLHRPQRDPQWGFSLYPGW